MSSSQVRERIAALRADAQALGELLGPGGARDGTG